MVSYEKPPKDTDRLIKSLVTDHRDDLARVKIGVLPVRSDSTVPPVEVRIVPPSARVFGAPDCILLLEGDRYEHASEKARLATIDHGLGFITTTVRSGALLVDAAGRPKLKPRLPDLTLSGHSDVLARWGEASLEATAAKIYKMRTRQELLKFDASATPDPDGPLTTHTVRAR